jgi:hypothetical protein
MNPLTLEIGERPKPLRLELLEDGVNLHHACHEFSIRELFKHLGT